MLKTPKFTTNEKLSTLLDILVSGSGAKGYKIIEEGVVEIGHFNLDHMIEGYDNNVPFYMRWPEFGEEYGELNAYGVCDSPVQFLLRFKKALTEDKRTFVVSFTHIEKDPSNAGKGGGWRWHKWGPYIGEGKPTMEYLDDEEEFEQGVFVYHIYQTAGDEQKSEWRKQMEEAQRGEAKQEVNVPAQAERSVLPNGVNLRHFPDHKLTAAFRISGKQAEIAFAAASPLDNWSRKLGRTIAINRLMSDKSDVAHRIVTDSDIPAEKYEKETQAAWDAYLLEHARQNILPTTGTQTGRISSSVRA